MKTIPRTKDQLSFLVELDQEGSVPPGTVVDYWRGPSVLHVPVDMMTKDRQFLQGQLDRLDMASTILIKDVQR